MLEPIDATSEYISVMGQSPVQGSKRSSARRAASKPKADLKSKIKQPNFDWVVWFIYLSNLIFIFAYK